jgi:hypothetical protein
MTDQAGSEPFDSELLEILEETLGGREVITTISKGKPNWVAGLDSHGVQLETKRSRELGRPAQLIPAWMLNRAWRYLTLHGSLPNKYLLATDGLNVKRSSAVCALLAQIPQVEVVSSKPIVLRLRNSKDAIG